MQHEMETSIKMEKCNDYKSKLEHVRGHAPFLQGLLKTLQEKTMKNPEKQQNHPNLKIEKIESLHKLLTNKNKNIPLPVLYKCEQFITSLKRKLKIVNISGNGNSSPSDIKPKLLSPSAPASPTPSSDMELEKPEPIIIPTERCENLSPQQIQKMPQQIHNFPQQIHNLPQQIHNLPQNTLNLPQQMQNLPQQMQNLPQQMQNLPQQMQNLPQKNSDKPGDIDNRGSKRPLSPSDVFRTGNTDPFDNRHLHEKINQNLHHHMQHHRHQQPPLPQVPLPHPPMVPPPSLPPLPGFSNSRPGQPPIMNAQLPPRPVHFLQQQCLNRPRFQMNQTPHYPPQPHNMPRNYPPPQIVSHQNNMPWASTHRQQQPRAVNLQNLVTVPINDTAHRNLKKANDFVKSPSPIVDVLKSPPLTADDIDDLLHDTGASDDVSHQSKKESSKPALSDFETVRQKLIKSMLSSNRQSSPKTSSPKVSTPEVSVPSPVTDANDRIANKYNPHRRKVPSELEHQSAQVSPPVPPKMSASMHTPAPPSDHRSRSDVRVDPRLSRPSFAKPSDPRLRNDRRVSNFQTQERGMIQKPMSSMNTTNVTSVSSPSIMSPPGRIPPLMSFDGDGLPRTPIYIEPSFNRGNVNNMKHMSHVNPYKWVNSGSINTPRTSFHSPSDKFHPMLNDQHERMQYMNSRKRRVDDNTPKTYGEYREAKRLAEIEKRRRSSSSSSGKPSENETSNMTRTTSDESKKRRLSDEHDSYTDRRRDSGRSVSGRRSPPQDKGRRSPSDKGRRSPPPDKGRRSPDKGRRSPDKGRRSPDKGRRSPDKGRRSPDKGRRSPPPDKGRRSPPPEKGRRSPPTSVTADDNDWDRDRNFHRKRDGKRREREDRSIHKSSEDRDKMADRDKKDTHEKTSVKRKLEKERKDEPSRKKIINNKPEKIRKNPMRISSDEDWDKIESDEEITVTKKESQKKGKDNSGVDKEKDEKKNASKVNEAPCVSESEKKSKTDESNRRNPRRSKQPLNLAEIIESESSDNEDDNIKLSKLVPKKTRSSAAKIEKSKDASSTTVEDIAAPIIESIKSCLPSAGGNTQTELNLEEMLRGALAPLLLQLGKAQTNSSEENATSTEKLAAKLEEEDSTTIIDTKKSPRTRKKKIDSEPKTVQVEPVTSVTLVEPEVEEDDDEQNDNGDEASAKGRKNRRVRSELDRLQEDTHDMFMLQGGISSTGRRRCTLAKPEPKLTPEPPKVGRGRGRWPRGGKNPPSEAEKEPEKESKEEVEIQELSPVPKGKGRGRPKRPTPSAAATNVEDANVKNTEEDAAQKPLPKKKIKKNIWVKTRRRRRVVKKTAVGRNRQHQDEEAEEEEDEEEHDEEQNDPHEEQAEQKEVEEKEEEHIIPAETSTEIQAVDVIRNGSDNAEVIIPDEVNPETGKNDEDPLQVDNNEIDTSAPVQNPLESGPNLQFNLMDEIICGENENNLNVEKERTLLLLAQQQNLNNTEDDQVNAGAGTSNSHAEVTEAVTEAPSVSENASTECAKAETSAQDLSNLELKEEKVSDDEFDSSIDCHNSSPNKDDFKSPTNSAKKRSGPIEPQKNVDRDMHCNSHYASKCVYCPYNGRYISNHYSHHHPESEVLISRFPQTTVDRLKSGTGIDVKSALPKTYRGTLLVHTCPFCVVEKSFTRICWIEHLGTHTGEYTFNCSSCRRPANDKIKIEKHCQAVCSNASIIRNRKLVNTQSTIKAYICNLCNYVQLDSNNMDRHLETQHEVDVTDQKTEVVLLNYPEFGNTQRQRSKGDKKNDKKCDTILILDHPSPPAADSLNQEQLEVFLPRGDDGLNLDKNMIELMSEISFSSSGKAAQSSSKSIADQLKDRFNNAEDEEPVPVKSQKTPSMADRLTERFKNMKENEEKEAKTTDAAASSALSALSVSTAPSASPASSTQGVQEAKEQSEENCEEIPPTSASKPDLDTEETSSKTKCTETVENDRVDIHTDENDAEWEDIEEIPEPNPASIITKKKSNKLYYETVSRLYATLITQPTGGKKTKKVGNLKNSLSATSNDESSNSCSAFSTASTMELNDKRESTTEASGIATPETLNAAENSVINGSINNFERDKATLHEKPTEGSIKPSCSTFTTASTSAEASETATLETSDNTVKTSVANGSINDQTDIFDRLKAGFSGRPTEVSPKPSCSEFSTASTSVEASETVKSETSENAAETSLTNGSVYGQTCIVDSVKTTLCEKPKEENSKKSCLSLLKAALDLEEDTIDSGLLSRDELKTPVKKISLKSALDLDSPGAAPDLLCPGKNVKAHLDISQKSIMDSSHSLTSTSASEIPANATSEIRPRRANLKQIVKKTVALKEMKKVENIGFTEKTAEMIECKCLLKDCTFVYVNDLRSVVRHFANNHPTQRWSGYCQTCEKFVETTSQLSIAKELLHINDAHVKGLLEKYKVECKVGSTGTLQVASTSLTLKPFSPTHNKTAGIVASEKTSQREMNTEMQMQICSPLKLSNLDQPATLENTQQVMPAEKQVITPVKVVDVVKPTLKVRRFSGDRLSKWEDSSPSVAHPPPQILNPTLQLDSMTYSSHNTPAGPSQTKTSGEMEVSVPGNKCPLRPWLNAPTRKRKEDIQEMLLRDRLLNYYKCMGDQCKFTANLSSQMMYHLRLDHVDPQVQPKVDPNQFKFLECAYCDMLHMNLHTLVNHITESHRYDVYQCPYCFYRSVSDYNVLTHLKAYHPLNIPSILACCCKSKVPRRHEEQVINVSRRKNVRKLSCSECSATFYILKDFEDHLRIVHPNTQMYKCNICMHDVRSDLITGHLLKVHSIGLYECIYCLFATNKLETIAPHLADRHPSRYPVFCARVPYKAVFQRNNAVDDRLTTSTVLVNLATSEANKNDYQFCPNEDPTELTLLLDQTDVVCNMKDVAFFQNFEGLALKEVMERYHEKSENDLKIYDEEVKANKIVSREKQKEKQKEPRLQIYHEQIIQQGERRNREDMMEVVEERAAADKNIRKYVENTGYSNNDIYRCPVEGCKDSFTNSMAFYGHSMRHSRKKSRLRCTFCNNYETTDWKLYRDHVVVHSRHRYFCYYCMKTGYSFLNITQHINNAHEVQELQMCPLIPNYNNEYEDLFIIAPMDTDPDLYMYRVMCHIATKRPDLKMYFMPDEVDLLPRQAIFLQELYCGIEKYKTKVRINMLRHMSRHANEVNVQTMKQDAVNPVPCLESNERHFDKMTNLACSSFETKGGKKDSPKNTLPAFVDESDRYVCGTPNCNYLTVNSEMLKCHLNTLHSSEKNYTCPHCKREISRGRLCAEKIVQHLKFHDINLFACSVCRKVHYFRHVIERHIQEKHRVDTGFIVMYSRTKNSTSQSILNIKCDNVTNSTDLSIGGKQKKVAIWVCSMCNLKLKTRLQMELHAKTEHNVVHQFTCRRCNTFVKNITEHTKARHPNLPVEAQCFYTREFEESKTETIISPPRTENSPVYDTTPLWRRDPNKIKSIRGILFEDDSPIANSRKPKAKTESTPVPKYTKISNLAPLKCTIFDDNSRFCHDCDYVAVSTERLIDHVKVAHNYPLNEFITFYGMYKFTCVQCDRDEKFCSVRKFQLHYDRYHVVPESLRIPSPLKLFSLCKIYTCYLCKETGTHDELKLHYSAFHGNQESLILRDGSNFTKCGLCNFKYYSPNHIDTLKEHYLTHHPITEVRKIQDNPYICLPREVLSYQLQEDALHIRCIKCNLDFSNETDFDEHHSKFHGVTAKSFKILRLVNYVCPECFKQFQLHESVLRHVCRQHSKISATNTEIESVLNMCERILVVFPSGLTLRRGDLKNTEYGNVEHVKLAIADIQNFMTNSINPPQSTPPPISGFLKPNQINTIRVNLNNENSDIMTYKEFIKTHKELRIHIKRINLQDLPDRIRCQTENKATDNLE